MIRDRFADCTRTSPNRLFHYLLVVILVLVIAISRASCKHILMVPFMNTSHTLVMHSMASRLSARGHSISVLWAREFPQEVITRTSRFSQDTNYSLFEFPLGLPPDELADCWRAAQEEFLSQQEVDTSQVRTGFFARAINGLELGRSDVRASGPKSPTPCVAQCSRTSCLLAHCGRARSTSHWWTNSSTRNASFLSHMHSVSKLQTLH